MRKRFEQIIISLVAIFSLAVATVSACTCSHHKHETVEITASCNEHTVATPEAANENVSACVDDSDDCVCPDTATRVSTKHETIRITKHAAAIPSVTHVDIAHVIAELNTAEHRFDRPRYLSDSFYNLAPKRGPPII